MTTDTYSTESLAAKITADKQEINTSSKSVIEEMPNPSSKP